MKKLLIIISILFFCINTQAASSTIVMETDTNRILYQNNAYEKRLIASTTKIMTFIVAYEYGNEFLDVLVEAGDEVLKMYGTSIYISYHEQMTLRDLLYGLMLRSGNDAAVVIAKFIAGNEENFVKLMNLKAQKLGMHNTIFNNPHGLDEETQNYSTAYDMALLSSYANKNNFYREVTGTKYHKVQTENKAYAWTNRNKMIFTYEKFISGKTGYTPSAGKTFVSTAKDNNLTLTVVTLNDSDIYETHKSLYEKMFTQYKNYVIVNKNTFPIVTKTNNKNAYLKENITYPIKDSEKDNLNIKVIIYEEKQNNIIGELKAYYKDDEIKSIKIYEKEQKSKEKISFFQKITNFFKNLF